MGPRTAVAVDGHRDAPAGLPRHDRDAAAGLPRHDRDAAAGLPRHDRDAPGGAPGGAAPGGLGAVIAFTDRGHGNLSLRVGDGDVLAARARALALVGGTLDDAVFMEQVHGDRVARVGGEHRGRGARVAAEAVAGVDALVTTEPGVTLVALAADCVPVVLVAPRAGVAVAHAGRRGVAAGVVPATVEALCAATGVGPGDLHTRLGPAIRGCCYELEATLVDEVAALAPDARGRTRAGTPSLDLPAAVLAGLAEAGLRDLPVPGPCTRCEHARWFSHRARTGGVAPAGRHAALVRMDAPPPRSAPAPSLDCGR